MSRSGTRRGAIYASIRSTRLRGPPTPKPNSPAPRYRREKSKSPEYRTDPRSTLLAVIYGGSGMDVMAGWGSGGVCFGVVETGAVGSRAGPFGMRLRLDLQEGVLLAGGGVAVLG